MINISQIAIEMQALFEKFCFYFSAAPFPLSCQNTPCFHLEGKPFILQIIRKIVTKKARDTLNQALHARNCAAS
jgi:hypothetical protein